MKLWTDSELMWLVNYHIFAL